MNVPTDTTEPEEEDEATRKDREGGRQFARVVLVLGLAYALAGALLFEHFAMAEVAIASGLIVVGAVAYKWPVRVIRLFTGMGDKL